MAAVEADHDLDTVAAASVDVVVVPDPGLFERDVEVDLFVDLLQPDATIGIGLDEQRPDHGGALDLDDLGVFVLG